MPATARRSVALCWQVYRPPRGVLGPPVVPRGTLETPGTNHSAAPVRGVTRTHLKFARNFATDAASGPSLRLTNKRFKLYSPPDVVHGKKDEDNRQALVLMFSWLLAPEKHIKKYVEMYTKRGLPVLTVTITPMDLLRPTRGTQVMTKELLGLLQENQKLQPLLVHGFSVGAYAYSEAMVHIMNDMDKYRPFLKRFVGQVWDCPVDLNGIPTGFPKAVTSNPFLQQLLRAFIVMYLNVMYKSVTVHYEKARIPYFTNILGVPALLLQSARDPVSTQVMTRDLIEGWRERGTKVTYKCFDEGAHVSLYWKNPTEYEQILAEFLEDVKLLNKS